jgi:hypothetical protein
MSIQERLQAAIDAASDKWSEGDKERALRVLESLVELHARAALGDRVDGSRDRVVATVAQITSTSSRQARSLIRDVLHDVVSFATSAVTKGL